MFFSRVFTAALTLVSFGVLAAAKPIHVASAIAERGLVGSDAPINELLSRSASCNTGGCNGNAVLNILLQLQVDVQVHVSLLDGHNSPAGPCNDIAAAIHVALGALAAVDVDISGVVGPILGQIAAVLAAILSGILGGCSKYGLLTILLNISVILDGVLAALINACSSKCPGLLGILLPLVANLAFSVLGFVLSALACGL